MSLIRVFPVLLACLLLVSAVQGCAQKTDPLDPSGKVKAEEPAQEAEKIPQKAEETAVDFCVLGKVEGEDLSSDGMKLFKLEELTPVFTAGLVQNFGPQDETGGRPVGWKYLVYRMELEADEIQFAATASVPSQVTDFHPEAKASKSIETPASCRKDMQSAECVAELKARIVEPALAALAVRTNCLCKIVNGPQIESKKHLQHSDTWVKGWAAQWIGEKNYREYVNDLLGLLTEESDEVLVPTIGALGRLKAAEAVQPMVDRSARASGAVARAVAVALSDIGTPAARKTLEEWSIAHPILEIRDVCKELLSGGSKPASEGQ